MLFSMLQIASVFDNKSERQDSNSVNEGFLQRAGQALVAGQYHRARPYSVEALTLYAYCKWMFKDDQEKDAWMIMGISARLAMRMGYHRDPRHLASITPFEGEMRRRTFFLVEIFDLLFAFQAGLPTIIHEEECDTEPPRNLFDTDFDEDCKALPPSRPPTDPTPMLYFCHKCQMAKIFRRIIRHALSPKSSPYEETMELDRELHKIHEDLPTCLRIRPFSSSFIEPSLTTSQRLTIDLMYLKCLCVLHRNFLSQGRSNSTYDYSRKSCVDAASRILGHQADLDAACQPGGLFHKDQWMLSNLASRDSILAAMIICLDLYESRNDPNIVSGGQNDHAEKYYSLQQCHAIWRSRRATSKEAARASVVLGVMLSKLPKPMDSLSPGSVPCKSPSVPLTPIGNNHPTNGSVSSKPIQSSWQPSESSRDDNTMLEQSSGNSIFTLFDDTAEFDWVSPKKSPERIQTD